jgi:hypothetical protein
MVDRMNIPQMLSCTEFRSSIIPRPNGAIYDFTLTFNRSVLRIGEIVRYIKDIHRTHSYTEAINIIYTIIVDEEHYPCVLFTLEDGDHPLIYILNFPYNPLIGQVANKIEAYGGFVGVYSNYDFISNFSQGNEFVLMLKTDFIRMLRVETTRARTNDIRTNDIRTR